MKTPLDKSPFTIQLQALQKRIYDQQYKSAQAYLEEGHTVNDTEFEHLLFSENNGRYNLYFYGDGEDHFYHNPDQWEAYEELFQNNEGENEFTYEHSAFGEFMDLLIQHPEKVVTLTFDGPGYGAHGTRSWDFSRLEAAQVSFPNLKRFKVQLYEPGDHNTIIIGEHQEPNPAQVTNLLLKMPNVQELEIPAVPDQRFFQADFPQLTFIKVQANYDHFNFIKHLSKSKILHQITIDYTDYLFAEDDAQTQEAIGVIAEELKAIEAQEQEEIDHLIANGFTKVEAAIELQRREMLEEGENEDEIKVMLDFTLTKQEVKTLLEKTFTTPEDVAIEMEIYESENRWLHDGKPNPEYIKAQEEAYLSIYDHSLLDMDFELPERSETCNQRTAFQDYEQLFKAYKKGSHQAFWLRESYLTKDALQKLAAINPSIQFKHIPMGNDQYIQHINKLNAKCK